MSEAEVMLRWNYVGPDGWDMPASGHVYGVCESSALTYKTRIENYQHADIFLQATVTAYGAVLDSSGQERYYSGFGLVAEDDPVMSYATIQLARNVAPAPYDRHTVTLTVNGVGYPLMDIVRGTPYTLKLRYLGRTNTLMAYVNGSLKKTMKWYPTMAPYVEVINVAVEAGQAGPERAYCDIGSLTHDVIEYNTEAWS